MTVISKYIGELTACFVCQNSDNDDLVKCGFAINRRMHRMLSMVMLVFPVKCKHNALMRIDKHTRCLPKNFTARKC